MDYLSCFLQQKNAFIGANIYPPALPLCCNAICECGKIALVRTCPLTFQLIINLCLLFQHFCALLATHRNIEWALCLFGHRHAPTKNATRCWAARITRYMDSGCVLLVLVIYNTYAYRPGALAESFHFILSHSGCAIRIRFHARMVCKVADLESLLYSQT